MCGRYVTKTDAALERAWEIRGGVPYFVSYNVAPATNVPIVCRDADGDRRCELVRWGLVPFFARGVPGKYATINARVETLRTVASYRGPWKRGQRCLFPATHFFEWQPVPGQKTKQPWCIRVTDAEVFAMAGLWDSSTRDDGEVILSAAIVTMPANELLVEIYSDKKRMPLILPPDAFDAWLSDDTDAAEEVIAPYPAACMEAWPVSTMVNKPVNDSPACIQPTA